MPRDPAWTQTVRRRLLALRRDDGGWGYRPDAHASAVEPSALAALGLLALDPGVDAGESRAAAAGAGRWIAARARRPDGSTGVTAGASADSPGWTTPAALLLWEALGGFARERSSALAWLLATRGKPGRPVPHNPMGHDVTLVGWPWVLDTHSWVEPTAISLLALAPSVAADHPRVAEGVRVLLDRAIPTGGWNLGNPVVFGQVFRPLPGPTGLALLALARVAPRATPPTIVAAAQAYLREVVRQTAAPTSLGWATLGRRAWGEGADSAAADHLARSTERALARGAGAAELALLLLAGAARGPAILGISAPAVTEEAR